MRRHEGDGAAPRRGDERHPVAADGPGLRPGAGGRPMAAGVSASGPGPRPGTGGPPTPAGSSAASPSGPDPRLKAAGSSAASASGLDPHPIAEGASAAFTGGPGAFTASVSGGRGR